VWSAHRDKSADKSSYLLSSIGRCGLVGEVKVTSALPQPTTFMPSEGPHEDRPGT